MTFEHYWTIFVKHWKLLLLCFLFMGAGTAIGSRLMVKLYQSTALVQVNVNTDSAYTSLLASNQVVQTEATLATGDSVLHEVASHYKGLTVDQISKEATATPKLNTQLFEISVLDPNPNQAAILANDIATTLVKQQFDVTRQGPVQISLLVVQQAQANPRPAQPNVLLNTSAGLLVGLLLGLVLAVLSEKLDTRIRSSETVSQLSGWSILATIWKLNDSKHKISGERSTYNINIEPYRMLRTSLESFNVDTTPLNTLMITSALPEDGRTTVVTNLAILMAKAGKNTLLVDADLRNPTIYKHFAIAKNASGLSNAILSMTSSTRTGSSLSPQLQAQLSSPSNVPVMLAPLENFIHATHIPNLWIMPSGTLQPDPPELLASKGMHSLLKTIKSYAFDIIIFDTPPLLGLSDGSILASKADGIVIVIDITRVTRGILQQVKNLLSQHTVHVIGCVVNKQQLSSKDRLFSSYINNKENIGNTENISTVPLISLQRLDTKIALPLREHASEEELMIANTSSVEDERKEGKNQADLIDADDKKNDDDSSEKTIKLTRLITGKGKSTNHAETRR